MNGQRVGAEQVQDPAQGDQIQIGSTADSSWRTPRGGRGEYGVLRRRSQSLRPAPPPSFPGESPGIAAPGRADRRQARSRRRIRSLRRHRRQPAPRYAAAPPLPASAGDRQSVRASSSAAARRESVRRAGSGGSRPTASGTVADGHRSQPAVHLPDDQVWPRGEPRRGRGPAPRSDRGHGDVAGHERRSTSRTSRPPRSVLRRRGADEQRLSAITSIPSETLGTTRAAPSSSRARHERGARHSPAVRRATWTFLGQGRVTFPGPHRVGARASVGASSRARTKVRSSPPAWRRRGWSSKARRSSSRSPRSTRGSRYPTGAFASFESTAHDVHHRPRRSCSTWASSRRSRLLHAAHEPRRQRGDRSRDRRSWR